MKNRLLKLLILATPAILFAQTDAIVDSVMRQKAERIQYLLRDKAPVDSIGAEAAELTQFLQLSAYEQGYRALLSELEESRLNKQTGAEANAAGTTSVVSKGSVPALLGLAVENGAMTRSTSGTTVIFRTSPANVYSALAKGGYLAAGPAVPELDGSFLPLAKRMSVYVSLDTSRGNSGTANTLTGDKQQLAAWGTRVELFNKRDPRRKEYKQKWDELMEKEGARYIGDLTSLVNLLRPLPEFADWRERVGKDVFNAKESEIPGVLLASYKSFRPIIENLAKNDPAIRSRLERAIASAIDFSTSRAGTINSIMKSWTSAIEYNFTKQANTTTQTTQSATGAAATAPSALPDLGNINFVLSKGFTDGPEFTFNAGLTWFQSNPSNLNIGKLRDIEASAQLDFPLKEIDKIGKPIFTLAGQFLSLREEPLGAKVIINTVPVTTKGNIGLFQAKLTVPTKSSGVSIPISVTWSNRTELIKEKDVRANIGISFDMDKLFAKP